MHSVGERLGTSPLVSVAVLLEAPDSFVGRTVRLEGDVRAMCHHRRGWFAIQDDGARDGRYVRVTTAPGFLVPAGSIGRRARTEGRVEVIEVPAAAARHYAAEHALGNASEVQGVERRVVLRATGAEFI